MNANAAIADDQIEPRRRRTDAGLGAPSMMEDRMEMVMTNMIENDVWSRRYIKEGHIWGDEPSITAERLNDQLNPSSKVLEIGFGYGRDLVYLLQQGHTLYGIEKAMIGLSEATAQIKDYVDRGHAQLILGDFAKTELIQGGFDAVFAHRVLHLLGQNGSVSAFVNRAAGLLKPGGLLYVSARDPRDFNPEQMVKNPNGTVTYRDDVEKLGDRRGQLISFWDKARFTETFSKKFDSIAFEETTEPESMINLDSFGKPVQTSITLMKARKRFDGPQNG